MADDYYVYLLVDHDPGELLPDAIFYVGKGRDTRALHHILEYLEAVENDELVRADAAQRSALGDEEAPDLDPELEHAKVTRIRGIRAAGRQVRIDLLRAELSSQMAYAIESAAIDVIGIDDLTNKVSGHEHFRAPAVAVARMLAAQPIDLDERVLQVTVVGLWGGRALAGLVEATDPEVIWENARQSWSIGAARRNALQEAYEAGVPVLLVAVSKGPSALWGGIILGVWEIQGTRPGKPRRHLMQDGSVTERPGWEFVRVESESPRLLQLRENWLQRPRRSTTPRQVGPTAVNW